MDVFISHSSKDKDVADKVVAYLEKRGVSCWIAPRNIVAGTDWAAAISDAISACRIFLIIYSANSSESEQVAREMNLAETCSGIYIVPYSIDGSELSGTFRYYLTGAHWIIADTAKNIYRLDDLYEMIYPMLNGTSTEAPVEPGRPLSHSSAPIQQPPKKRYMLPLLITLSAVVLCAAAAVTVAVLASRPVQVATGFTADDGTVKDMPFSILFNRKTCNGSYTGGVSADSLPDGSGTFNGNFISETGARCLVRYDGGFKNGEADGSAEITINEPGHSVLTGTFELKNGLYSGKANYRVVYSAGGYSSYEGDMENGTQNGSGLWVDCDEDGAEQRYIGQFSGGFREGTGQETITYTSGDKQKEEYSGDYIKNLYEGIGTYSCIYADNTTVTYTGGFSKSSFSGQGEYCRDVPGDSRVYYKGEFSEGAMQGSGVMTIEYTDGMKYYYEGNFVNNNCCGKGDFLIIQTDGTQLTYSGDFADGVPHGNGRFRSFKTDGSCYEAVGEFSEGEFTGNGTIHEYSPDSTDIPSIYDNEQL